MLLSRRDVLGLAGSAALMAACPAAFAASPIQKLLWPRPILHRAQIIDVDDYSLDGLTQGLDRNTDYIIRLGLKTRGRVTKQFVNISGGRNIQVIGGHLIRTADSAASDARGQRLPTGSMLFNIENHTGTAYVEGLLLDVNGQYGVDGIHVGSSAAPGNYIFQNIHVRGVTGTVKGNHADGLQIVGPVNKLWIGRTTIYSAYQGFEIAPQFPFGDVWLKDCNARYPNPDFRRGQANGYALWMGDGTDDQAHVDAAHYRFDNVYVEERTHYWTERWAEGSIGPGRTMKRGNRMIDNDPARAAFPGFKTEGYVTRGVPPGGDFMPADRIINHAGEVVYGLADWR